MAKADGKSSVWFVARMRVRVKHGTKVKGALRRMAVALHKGVGDAYGKDSKGGAVVAIEDPFMMIAPQDTKTEVPVIIGTVTVCPGAPKVGTCLMKRDPQAPAESVYRIVDRLTRLDKYRFADKDLVADVIHEAIKVYSGQ